MITFACLHCGKTFTVADELAGRRGKCKACHHDLVVPAPSQVPISQIPVQQVAVSQPAPFQPPHMQAAPSLQTPSTSPGQQADPGSPYRLAGPAGPGAASPYDAIYVANSPQSQPATAPGKLPVRVRRLIADAEQMARSFQNTPLIRIRGANGNPPELYHIEYSVRGLARGAGNKPMIRESHVVEIQLTREYPRQSPKCKMLTPVFHPNIEPAAICVGDHWTAAERLVDLVLRIGEMITYQAYNIKSPLDGEAAMWADMNRAHLPIDRRDLRPPEMG
jgi:ubiquitin-protein ligase